MWLRTSDISYIRHPVSSDNLQHAGFRRLRSDKEPESGGEVEPGVSHQLWIVQQNAGVTVESIGKHSIVVVP